MSSPVIVPSEWARGRDQADFAPRVKQLGTAPADKKGVVFDTPHDINQQKGQLSREVLAWLDKYLGRVN